MSNTLAYATVKALPPVGAPTIEWLKTSALGQYPAYLVMVTPAMAAEWLKLNRDNRKFRAIHARTIAEEMARGEWRLTHQGIAFGTTGRLLDGQHRLSAIVESNTTQPMLVFVDVHEDTFANFDRGAQRGISDVLLEDAKRVSIAGTLVRICVRGGYAQARKAMPAEVRKVLEVFAPDLAAMNEASLAQRTGRTLSSIKAAWMVHHHGADDAGKKLLRQQWKAFAEYDIRRMDESTASGDRRLENFKAVRGGAVETESACIGWLMFDPLRRDLSRVLIRSTSTALHEMQAAARVIVPELVPNDSKPKAKVEAPKRYSPFADPELGPELRRRAAASNAERMAARV